VEPGRMIQVCYPEQVSRKLLFGPGPAPYGHGKTSRCCRYILLPFRFHPDFTKPSIMPRPLSGPAMPVVVYLLIFHDEHQL
jgi:hypothetical protein